MTTSEHADGSRDVLADAPTSIEELRIRANVEARLFDHEPDPVRVGRYVVLSRHGRGGMGHVYVAWDPVLDRKVALKLLSAAEARLLGDAGQAQLLAEGRAIARLSHPNVVGVFDLGVHREAADERLFLALELVEGQTLRQRIAGLALPWRTAVELALPIARGLAAVHAVGLVHGDVKPDNVVIAVDGTVKLLDFGLARANRPAAMETAAGGDAVGSDAIAGGTLAYLAPEVARSGASAATDQFALCVLLYEMLHARRPFVAPNARDLAADVFEGPVMDRRLPRRLRALVLRGLAPDPGARFDSVATLAAELEHVRRGPWQRRWLLAIAGLAVAAITAGYAIRGAHQPCAQAADGLAAVWNERVRQDVHAAMVAVAVPYAAKTTATTLARLDAYADAWAIERRDACEASIVRREQPAQQMDARMACLDRRLRELDALVVVLHAPDALTVEHAAAAADGLPAIADCREGGGSLGESHETDAPTRGRIDAIERALARVDALQRAGAYASALAAATELEADAADVAHPPTLAEVLLRLGTARRQAGDYAGARVAFEEAYTTALGARADTTATEAAIGALDVVGHVDGDSTAAAVWDRCASALLVREPDERRRVRLTTIRGLAAARAGRFEDAVALHTDALVLAGQQWGDDALQVALVENNLGIALMDAGRLDEALAHLTRSHAIKAALLGDMHPQVATAENGIANVHYHAGRYDDAIVHHERAIAIRRASLPPDHPYLAASHNNLATVLERLGRATEALANYRDASSVLEAAHGPEHLDVATASTNIGNALLATGEAGEAVVVHERVLAMRRRLLPADHPDVAASHNNLANALSGIGRREDALAHYRDALAIWERRGHVDAAVAAVNLADELAKAGELADALRHLDHAIEIRETHLGAASPRLVGPLVARGELLLRLGRRRDAQASLQRALDSSDRGDADPDTIARAHALLARAMASAGTRDRPARR